MKGGIKMENTYSTFLVLKIREDNFQGIQLLTADNPEQEQSRTVSLSWTAHQNATEYGIDLGDTRPQFALYSISAILLTYYVVTGPKQSVLQEQQLTESE